MNPNRWTPPVLPALIVAVAGLTLTTTAIRAQSAPSADAATLAKYDANKNGVLDPAEVSAMQADQAAPAAAATEASATGSDIITMSPFQVERSRDRGFAAENTLAGSRLNTKLEDLAASITVVTKQQLEDTAALDINDVFKYEAGTEGSASYTPFLSDRSTFKDGVGGYTDAGGATTTNATSNRVRGLSAPDAAVNNYPTNNRIPFDAYNTQSVEISRGPNSMLFGMGSPAGIVNQSTAPAVLNRNSNTVQLRTDNNGSFRASLSFNRSIIEDKVAIFGAFLYNDQQFERKPSFDKTRRQYGSITIRPWEKTVIRGSFENYSNDANRPNSVTPRDYATSWFTAGRPAYDPVAGTITFLDTGRVIGPIWFNSRSPNYNSSVSTLVGAALISNTASPWYTPEGIQFDTGGSPLQRLDNGRQVDYFLRGQFLYATAHTNPATNTVSTNSWAVGDPRFLIMDRQWTDSAADFRTRTWVQNGTTYRLNAYNLPGVTNKALYDWTKYNLLEPNFGELKAKNYNVEFEQQITDNLFFSAGWFRQEIKSASNYILNQLQGNTLQIDTNTKLPNGQNNPYFGLPLVQLGVGNGVDTFFHPEIDDNYRAMLAYNIDFTKNDNLTRWFGHHRLLALWSSQEQNRKQERWRLGYRANNGSDADAILQLARNLSLANQSIWSVANMKKFYYLATPGDPQGTVTHSAGYYGNPGWNAPYRATIEAYKFNATNADVNRTTGDGFRTYNVTEAITFADATSYSAYRRVDSINLGTQSYLWNDRIIATLGWRRDDYEARQTTTGAIVNPDGTTTPSLTGGQLYANGYSGDINRDLVMNRWGATDKLRGTTKTVGLAIRPFRDWKAVSRLGGEGSLLSEFVQGATFYINKSDNFNAPGVAATDYARNTLPKPTGETKEYGFGFNLFNNKLVARINWFETKNHDERTSIAGNLLTRLIYPDTTTGIAWASAVVRLRKGIAAGRTIADITSDSDWNSDNTAAGGIDISSDADQNAVWALLQLPRNYYAGITVAGTQESLAKGQELQLTYNPTSRWTMKLTATNIKSTYTKVAPQYDSWLAVRMPVWQSMSAPDIPDFTTTYGGTREWSLRNYWTGYGFHSVALRENTNGITSPQTYFDSIINPEYATAKDLEGKRAPNQRQYNVRYLTTYTFGPGRFRGFAVGGSERWESKAAVGYYGYAANPLTPDLINKSDINRPVYFDNGLFYTDVWLSYSRKIFSDRVNMKLQLNIDNVFESGGLRVVAANWDGSPWAYRIIDPRRFSLTATFGF